MSKFFKTFFIIIFFLCPLGLKAKEKIVFGIGWKAEPEYGGFYQAKAEGIYDYFGLDVDVKTFGPRSNMTQMLIAKQVDFRMGGNGFISLNYVKENLPFVSVAALFQKDPVVLLYHPDTQIETIEDLIHRKGLIASAGRITWWKLLVEKYGFRDEMIQPYTFSLAPFIANNELFQQGYLTSEPYALEKAGIKPKLFLLSDHGYSSYSTMIDTSYEMIEKKPDIVQNFVNATILGYYSYLYGDSSKANEMIKKANPAMIDDKIAYSIATMKKYGVVDNEETKRNTIGMMTDKKWKHFFEESVKISLYSKNLDYTKAYNTRFINKAAQIKSLAKKLKINLSE